MAGLRVQYEESEELQELVQAILQKYENRFYFINFNDILCVEESNKKPKHIAKIRILEAPLTLLSNKKIIIEIARQNWDPLTYNQKLLVTFHELMHVEYCYEYDDYKIVHHDVEDFREILARFGLEWNAQGNEVENILENPEIWDEM